MNTMQIRCTECNKQLAKNFTGDTVSIKCPRCGTINSVDRTKLRKEEKTFAKKSRYRNRMFNS